MSFVGSIGGVFVRFNLGWDLELILFVFECFICCFIVYWFYSWMWVIWGLFKG